MKDSQPALADAVKLWFDAGKLDRPFWDDIQTGKDHGRIETRRYLVTMTLRGLGSRNSIGPGYRA